MDQKLLAIAFLRRLDIQELIEFLHGVYSGDRILVDHCIFEGANDEAVRYDVYLDAYGIV